MTKKHEWDETLPDKARDAWQKASVEEKEDAIKRAAIFIDMFNFKGKRLKETQGLSWPRTDVFRDDGEPVVGVPQEIKEASALVAGFIVADVPLGPASAAWVISIIGHLLEEDFNVLDSNITWH
jgi:hypothetical protein